jgi:hypothetical protein
MDKTKKSLTITIDQKIFDLIEKNIGNRSKYIEWLIYQDLLKSDKTDRVDNVIL